MSPEFGSTCAIFPIDAETLRYLEFSGRPAEQVERVETYAKAQGLWHDDRLRGADVLRDARARPRRGRPVARGPEAPAGPRLADRVQGVVPDGARRLRARGRRVRRAARGDASPPATRPRRGLRPSTSRTARRRARRRAASRWPSGSSREGAADAGRRHRDRARPRPRRDRGDHVVHEHVEPVRDDRRRAARPQRGRARPAVQAVGQDVARAGLEGRDGVLRRGRASSSRWRRSASTSSATAARPASATPARCRRRSPRVVNDRGPRGRLGAQRQPQLRGPHQPRREDELPRLAAARGRLRAGGDDGHRPARRAARPGRATATTSSCTTSGPPRRRSGASSRRPCARRCSRSPTARCSRAARSGTRSRCPRATATPGREDSTYVRRPSFLEDVPREPEPRGDIEGARVLAAARRLGHDRPHLAGRLDQEGLAGGALPQRARRREARLQLLRRAPRQPRGDDARHVRQHPPAQPARRAATTSSAASR